MHKQFHQWVNEQRETLIKDCDLKHLHSKVVNATPEPFATAIFSGKNQVAGSMNVFESGRLRFEVVNAPQYPTVYQMEVVLEEEADFKAMLYFYEQYFQ